MESIPVDNKSCSLMGPTGLAVQAGMGVIVMLSLVFKRHQEPRKRPWRIWLFDVSKQAFGQMFVHSVNVLMSGVVAQYANDNACVFYFLNILLDTTLGVAILYLILQVLAHFFVHKFGLEGFQSGVYGSPPSFSHWVRQTAVYVVALTSMKLLVLVLLILFPGVLRIGEWLLKWTWTEEGNFQVIFTMGIFPMIMNIIQFWLIDSIVKDSGEQGVALDVERIDSLDSDPDREPLFQASDDDDDSAQQHHYSTADPIPQDRAPSKRRDSNVGPESHRKVASDGSMELHDYPPNSETTSSMSFTPPNQPKISTQFNKAKRRGPPTPINVPHHEQKAIASNSPWTASGLEPNSNAASKPTTPQTKPIQEAPDESNAWDHWDDDDWGERVGEEEWTGRRMGQSRENVDNVWNDPIVSSS